MDTNTTFWTEFVEIYRKQVCLWDVKSNEYFNKHKRNESYDTLLKKLREINPQATVEILKKKINNMRTTFRRELKKVQWSKGTGTGGDTYEPTLWYYDLLLFTTQLETGRKGIFTDELADNFENGTVDTLESDDTEEGTEAPPALLSSASEAQLNLQQNENTTATSQNFSDATPRTSRDSSYKSGSQSKGVIKRKKTNYAEQKRQELANLAHTALSQNENNEDEYTIAAIAEKLISDVMFYAKMDKLTEDTSIHIPSYSQFQININHQSQEGYVPCARPHPSAAMQR
ncbi:hypothetical protein NQ314_005596, partial [Rhamnusium bicolor]